MKAWVIHAYNDMKLEDVPDPEVKSGWALVKVKVVQPSVTEILFFKGIKVASRSLTNYIENKISKRPVQMFGHEFSGDIVKVGGGVEDFEKGDRVANRSSLPCHKCELCRTGQEDKCRKGYEIGIHFPGAFAEYISVPAEALAKLPDNVDYNEGACIQPLSDAVQAVQNADIQMGDTVAVLGQGPIGLASMQTVNVSGASQVIVTDVREEVLKLSKRLGADYIINAKETDITKRILELTDNEGADVVIEAAAGSPKVGLAGTKTLDQALRVVKDAGKIIQVAIFDKPLMFDTDEFRGRSIRYIFPDMCTKRMLEHSVKLVASGRVELKPMITHVLEGIGKVPESFEITQNKVKYNAINPAQVVI